jgi:hypothetical protein
VLLLFVQKKRFSYLSITHFFGVIRINNGFELRIKA